MRICKFREVHDEDYRQIFQIANGWKHKQNNEKFRPFYVKHSSFFCLIQVTDLLLKDVW